MYWNDSSTMVLFECYTYYTCYYGTTKYYYPEKLLCDKHAVVVG